MRNTGFAWAGWNGNNGDPPNELSRYMAIYGAAAVVLFVVSLYVFGIPVQFRRPTLEWAEYTCQIRALALSTLAQGAGGPRHTRTGSGAGMEVEPSSLMSGQVVLLALDRARARALAARARARALGLALDIARALPLDRARSRALARALALALAGSPAPR